MKPNYYSVIPAVVRYDNDLTDSEKLLYSEIAALSNQNGECWAGNTYFSKLYGVTTETISRRISRLRKKGYITVEIKYKNKSKEIDKRIVKIINTYPQDNQGGIDGIINRGIDANVKGNSTSIEYYKINNKTYSPLEAFELFYSKYPKKVQKGRAEKSFKSNVKESKTLELILQDLEKRSRYYDWKKDNGKYIPHPSTYLNGKQWLDEYSVDSQETYKSNKSIKHHTAMPKYSSDVEIEEDVDQLLKELREEFK